MEAVLGALSATDNIIQGAYLLGKGILHPTLPLRAYLTRLSSPSLPRTGHSVSVVKGRAYIFGGDTSPGHLANNDMHIIILPSSGVSDTDYRLVPARGTDPSAKAVPCARKHHTASVVGDRIYIYGGWCGGVGGRIEEEEEEEEGEVEEVEEVEEEKRKVWVFDTTTNTWSFLQAQGSSRGLPAWRARHAAAASELPPPPSLSSPLQTDGKGKGDVGGVARLLPQAPPDPAKHLVEPPSPSSYGTLFLFGGVRVGDTSSDEDGSLLGDTWAFDIRSRTWTLISEGDGARARRRDAALAMAGQKLYRSGGVDGAGVSDVRVESLDVSAVVNRLASSEKSGMRKLSLPQSSTREEWSLVGASRDGSKAPAARAGAGLLPVTTGQGRDYLLLVGGIVRAESPAGMLNREETKTDGEGLTSENASGDIWAFQLPPAATTAAVVKDTTRKAMHMDTREAAWAEAQYRYLDAMRDEISHLEAGVGVGRGIGARKGFAVAKGTEVDGATAIVWGGTHMMGKTGEAEEVLGDGWMITVDR